MKAIFAIMALSLVIVSCSSKEEAMEQAETKVESTKDSMAAKATEVKESAESKVKEMTSSSSSDMMETSCSSGKDVRKLMIKKTDAGGCELAYSKFGSEKSIASSGISVKYCEEVSKKVQNNLAKSGFSCQ